jgi:uncharacterized membrane protein YeaQ/YmgE (transglycosylase-associated protein family)
MRMRGPTTHALTIGGGFTAGLLIGDHIFPELESAFGDPMTDLFLGVLGAIVAGLIYELVDHTREIETTFDK